jgi:hypothetical protein
LCGMRLSWCIGMFLRLSVNRYLQDIMAVINPTFKFLPFGGLVVVFGGDFQQILLVVPRGTRGDVVAAALNRSSISNMCVYSSCTPTCACRGCWLRVGRMHRQMPHGSKHLLIICNMWGRA